MIPALIRKMLESPSEIVLWGDGSPTREFLYVEDCAEALAARGRALRRRRAGQPRHRARRSRSASSPSSIAELTGFAGEIVWDTSMPNGQPRRSLDASRAKELFGFEARTPLREGLERTIAWYRAQARLHAAR